MYKLHMNVINFNYSTITSANISIPIKLQLLTFFYTDLTHWPSSIRTNILK